ncbi:hypothetical protein DY000_02016202 [Brassica cretica]|uniref:Uncharacterized protein n=1 Tax=Brassica cretica TaxID=69181 RepID=A0ABQ7DCM7_BRACR|nr:hypothetical protein DY000_02016202 [Brassica cretica]
MDSWSLEIDLVTRRLREAPGVFWRPGGRGGARRFSLDLEIALGAQRSFYRSWDHDWSPEAENPEVSSLDPEIADWNPEEPGGSSLYPEIFDWNPEAIGSPGGPGVPWEPGIFCLLQGPYSAFLGKATTCTCLDFAFCRSKAGHYRVLMLYSTFAGVGVMTQVQGFAAFHVWRSRILIAPCTFHIGTLGTPMRLRLHRGFRIGGLWRPDPARMPL